MELFKKEQLTTVSRHRNSIEAAKIVNIDKNSMTIERFNGQTLNFPVSNSVGYEIEGYCDIQYFRTGNASHTMKLVGVTPKEFIPDKK